MKMTNFQTTVVTAITGAAIGLAGVIGLPASADPTDGRCEPVNESTLVCVNLVSSVRGIDDWEVGISDGDRTEVFEITCNDYTKETVDWSSYGNWSESAASNFAMSFCTD